MDTTEDAIAAEVTDALSHVLLDTSALASPTVEVLDVLITPAIARDILENHHGPNRSVSERVVTQYRHDIEDGLWRFTADTVRFDRNGTLLDGQHRLTALSTMPDTTSLRTLVVLGLESDAILFMDQGAKRTGGHQLAIMGIKNSTAMAGAVRLVMAWEDGRRTQSAFSGTTYSVPAVEQWAQAHADEVEMLNEVFHHYAYKVPGPTSVYLATTLLFARLDADAALEFLSTLAEGGAPRESPITLLDRKLNQIARERHSTITKEERFSMVVRAWNAWRRGEQLTRILTPRPDSTMAEPV